MAGYRFPSHFYNRKRINFQQWKLDQWRDMRDELGHGDTHVHCDQEKKKIKAEMRKLKAKKSQRGKEQCEKELPELQRKLDALQEACDDADWKLEEIDDKTFDDFMDECYPDFDEEEESKSKRRNKKN